MRKRQGKNDNNAVTLGDILNDEVAKQLQKQKRLLKEQEKEAELARQKQEKIEREKRDKNKSFEQLLKESELDWKHFK